MWTEYISYSIERRPSKVLWISLYFIQQHHQLEALNRFIFRGISQQIACMITVQEYDFWKWATHERLKSQLLPHSLPILYLCDVQIDVRPLRVHTFTCKSFNMQRLQCAVFNLYVDGASMSEKAATCVLRRTTRYLEHRFQNDLHCYYHHCLLPCPYPHEMFLLSIGYQRTVAESIQRLPKNPKAD